MKYRHLAPLFPPSTQHKKDRLQFRMSGAIWALLASSCFDYPSRTKEPDTQAWIISGIGTLFCMWRCYKNWKKEIDL